ncbi:1,6-anhydro-N-acetylmuramyl-L-alanine amidase AmpD [Variovorax sp. PBS-H4]|uniref:1,6-anhydro-N-acetylmuramyl-L-alanine amidase AmpD n=1 Tax=Variovorax sp. PBS-H4 TaxID=434008 RepID=UPI0013191182|nr:1,6-anhydro-N-acetylmuramyl-L-alanine amidase AmpD [Variovorax sp. PBS-H4]VTU22450.1 1,6-anhydro-N-acetylmuramyl-L-alanine amidase AmpD [Variovorax sp. PBS-H4]
MAAAPTTDARSAELWQDGWYRFARSLRSPNFGPRPAGAQIDLIVLHSISLPPGRYGGDEVQRLFTNMLDWDAHPYFDRIRGLEVSAHFYVRRNGELWQFVSCDDRAWHAGPSFWRGRPNCNDDSIGIELEGLEGEGFESAQYETLTSLCPAIAQRYAIAFVAGHEHIAPGRKADPGSGFDWLLLQQHLGWQRTMFPDAVRAR